MTRLPSTVVQLSLLVVLVVWFFYQDPGADKATMWVCLLIFYGNLYGAFANPVVVLADTPSYLTFRVGSLIFFYLLYFYPYQQFVLGFDTLSSSIYIGKTYDYNSNFAIMAATIAVVGLCAGHQIGSKRARTNSLTNLNWRLSRYIGPLTLFLLLSALVVYMVMDWRSSGEGAYTFSQTGGVLADGLAVVLIMLCMLSTSHYVVQLSASKKPRILALIGALVSIGWSLRLLYFGDRNSFLLIILSGLVPASMYLLRISRIALVLGLGGMLTLYYSVEVIRSQSLNPDHSIYDSITSASLFDADKESSFNISAITLRATFDIVPWIQDYAFGLYKVVGLMGIFPFSRSIIFQEGLLYDTTAAALTDFLLPPHAGWSVGTGLVADLYFDFGICGVAIGSLLIGWAGRRLEAYLKHAPFSERTILMYSLATSLLIEIPRYSVDFPIRIIVWSAMITLISRLMDQQALKTSTRVDANQP